MIRPSTEVIDAIVDAARDWPAEDRAKLIDRLERAHRERAPFDGSGSGLSAAEVIARFGVPGPGPTDETVDRWIRELKDSRGGR